MRKLPAIQIGDHDTELPTYPTIHPIIEQNRKRMFGVDNVIRLTDEDQINPIDYVQHHPVEDAFMYPYVPAPSIAPAFITESKPPVGGLDIYIAGPMTGLPHFNFPAFYAAQKMLESHGHRVFNPAEQDKIRHGGIDISIGNYTGDHTEAVRNHGFSLREALRDDTHYICTTATAIAMLPGWKKSKGACAEHELAHALGLVMIYLGGFYA